MELSQSWQMNSHHLRVLATGYVRVTDRAGGVAMVDQSGLRRGSAITPPADVLAEARGMATR